MIKIRPIEVKDNSEIAKLIRNCFEEFKAPLTNTVYDDPRTWKIYEMNQGKNAEYFILEENNKVVGGCGYYPTEGLPEGMCELVKYYLCPEARHRGLGTKIFLHVIEEATKAGYKKIYIESFPEFSKAVSIYEKAGFKRVNEQIGNSGHTATTIWMVKEV
ncbi:MAG: GNAT family N-acetyltransferase [archaeon]|nr:GNAT family N-acetyltransferase [archaeon]